MKMAASFANNKLPRWGQWVMVVTPLGSRLGFLDPQAGWRDARDGSLLGDVQSWHPMDSEQAPAMRTASQQKTRQAEAGRACDPR